MRVEQLVEMAAKKQCDKCGKTMAANHYWYKGAWKCKKAKPEEAEKKAEPAEKRETRDYVPKDANEEAATKRAFKFYNDLEKERSEKK